MQVYRPPSYSCSFPLRAEQQEDRDSNCDATKYYGPWNVSITNSSNEAIAVRQGPRTQIAQVAVIGQWDTRQLAALPWSRLVIRGREKL